tara:strand:- start:3001 stop:3615 length:615 start_codon:yes stop_codon:yes gene_type:complete
MFVGQKSSEPRRGDVQGSDPFGAAPPGISLTVENEHWPWGNPPKNVDVDVVLEQATGKLDSDEEFRGEMFKLLIAGVSVEHIVESWVMSGFENGDFSLDVGLIAKGPLAVYVAYLADQEGVPYRMFEQDDPMSEGKMDDREFLELLKINNPRMFSAMRQKLNQTLRQGGNDDTGPGIQMPLDDTPVAPPTPQGFMNTEETEDGQ